VADSDSEDVLRALRRTKQIRSFTDEPVAEEELLAILEVARWTGSSENGQPWTFQVLRDRAELRRIAELARYARHVGNAPIAVAIVMPGEDPETDAYDEGRVAERILVAASAMGLGAGIAWTVGDERAEVGSLLGITPPAFVRTIVSLGHPTESALRPRSGSRSGRRPLSEFVRER
jgi:nitroreductase